MPLYNKRIVGPSVSYPPEKFADETQNVQSQDLISGKRRDGRSPHEFRPFFLKVDVVSQAAGSAYIEIGKTKILCSVYGPKEISKKVGFSIKGQIFCEFKYASFSCPVRRQFQQDQEEKELSQILKQTLEPAICLHKFPKAQLDIYVLVLDNDGGALSGAITAAGAALSNAGILMFDFIMGCSLVCKGDLLLIDPTAEEENINVDDESTNRGTMVLGLMPSFQQVACLLQDGTIEKHMAIQGLNKLNDCCHQIKLVVEQALIKTRRKESSNE